MDKEYLDREGNPLKEGFYKEGNILLQIRYISPNSKGGWQSEDQDGNIIKLDPNVSKHNFVPLSGGSNAARPLCYELSRKAKFIRSKLEQLAQSEKPLIPPKLAVITNSDQ